VVVKAGNPPHKQKKRNPQKGRPQRQSLPPTTALLRYIIDALSLLLITEKVGKGTQKRIEAVIAVAEAADEKDRSEKDKKETSGATVTQGIDPVTRDDIRDDLIKVHDSLIKHLNVMQNTALESLTGINTLSLKTTEISGESKNLTAQIGKVTESTDKIASNTTAYRDVVLTGKTQENKTRLDPKILVDLQRKDKQLWVDIHDKGDVNTLSKSLSVLVEQANTAIDSLVGSDDKPDDAKVVAVLKTRGDALLLTFNSKAACGWVRRADNISVFTEAFVKNSFVRQRRYNLVVPRVPLTFNPEDLKHLRELEETNGLAKYSLYKAKWIKPAERRRPDQLYAYLMLTTLDVGAANAIIRDGLFICNARVRPTKQKQEPMQCMKCRKWGHFAATCTAEEDTCGSCGEAHRTAACTAIGKVHCVSCKDDSHPSRDRRCPEFLRRCAIFDERNPGNTMPYFPTDEDWTLAVRPDRISIPERFPAKFAVNSLPSKDNTPHSPRKKRKTNKAGKAIQGYPNNIPVAPPHQRSSDPATRPLAAGVDWRAILPDASTVGPDNTDEQYPHPRDAPGW
jgi:hypothetical protein